MMQPRDIAVLLAVVRCGEGWTMRSVGDVLGLAPAGVHRSLARLASSGAYSSLQRRPNSAVLEELLRHGLRFVDTRQLGAEGAGYPTAWGVEPLRSRVWNGDGAVPVWPSAHGPERGPTLEPLVPDAAQLVERAPELAGDLALVDAIRVGRARERALAAELLIERLIGVPA